MLISLLSADDVKSAPTAIAMGALNQRVSEACRQNFSRFSGFWKLDPLSLLPYPGFENPDVRELSSCCTAVCQPGSVHPLPKPLFDRPELLSLPVKPPPPASITIEHLNKGKRGYIVGFGGFSWKRALGITKAKQQLSRKLGIPLTKSGRQRKLGGLLYPGRRKSGVGCVLLFVPVIGVGVYWLV